MKENEVWVFAGESGLGRHAANRYWVVRKLKRGGYSVRFVERGFNGYTVSTKTQRFETLEDLFAEVAPDLLLEALEKHPHREFWREEIEYLQKLLGREKRRKAWRPAFRPTRQVSLLEVIS